MRALVVGKMIHSVNFNLQQLWDGIGNVTDILQL